MKIFIVEDNDDRIQWFRDHLLKHDVTVCKTATDGISRLSDDSYDLIFLDHDLGDRAFVDSSDENTGYQVAVKLRKSDNLDATIIVHSWNVIGARNILGILNGKALYMPFNTSEFLSFVKSLN